MKEKLITIINSATSKYNAVKQAEQDAYNAAQLLLDPEWVAIPYVPNIYTAEYEEAKMMNINVDEKAIGQYFAYIEEFAAGAYDLIGYVRVKKTKVDIRFLTFCELENTANDRDDIRAKIEEEIVLPFIDEYNSSGLFERNNLWEWEASIGQFDANEVGISLRFELIEGRQC